MERAPPIREPRKLAPAKHRAARVQPRVQPHHRTAYRAAEITGLLAPTCAAILRLLILCADANGVVLAGPEWIRDRLPRVRVRRNRLRDAGARRPDPHRRIAPSSELVHLSTVKRWLVYLSGRPVAVNGERMQRSALIDAQWVTRGRVYRGIRTSHGFVVHTLRIPEIERLAQYLDATGMCVAMDRSFDRSILFSSLSPLSSPLDRWSSGSARGREADPEPWAEAPPGESDRAGDVDELEQELSHRRDEAARDAAMIPDAAPEPEPEPQPEPQPETETETETEPEPQPGKKSMKRADPELAARIEAARRAFAVAADPAKLEAQRQAQGGRILDVQRRALEHVRASLGRKGMERGDNVIRLGFPTIPDPKRATGGECAPAKAKDEPPDD